MLLIAQAFAHERTQWKIDMVVSQWLKLYDEFLSTYKRKSFISIFLSPPARNQPYICISAFSLLVVSKFLPSSSPLANYLSSKSCLAEFWYPTPTSLSPQPHLQFPVPPLLPPHPHANSPSTQSMLLYPSPPTIHLLSSIQSSSS